MIPSPSLSTLSPLWYRLCPSGLLPNTLNWLLLFFSAFSVYLPFIHSLYELVTKHWRYNPSKTLSPPPPQFLLLLHHDFLSITTWLFTSIRLHFRFLCFWFYTSLSYLFCFFQFLFSRSKNASFALHQLHWNLSVWTISFPSSSSLSSKNESSQWISVHCPHSHSSHLFHFHIIIYLWTLLS